MVTLENQTIAVWFSCGAASAVAAKLTLEKYPQSDVRIVNSPIAEEHPDNLRFKDDVEVWLDHPIETAINPKYPNCSAVEVWDKRKYMGGIAGAPCTVELKKEARYEWERNNPVDWHVLGFTLEERGRHKRFISSETDRLLPVLIDAKMNKIDCMMVLTEAGIKLPDAYWMGMPNANCLGCVKASSPTYWNLTRQVAPDVFAERAEQSRRIGARLVRVEGERIYLDELDPQAKGGAIKDSLIECGIFCEER